LNSPLAALADVAAVFDTGPEAVEGSTRLAAGTAQKAAFGVISTLAAAELGYVHGGLWSMSAREREAAGARKEHRRTPCRRRPGDSGNWRSSAAGGDVPDRGRGGCGFARHSGGAEASRECGGDLAEALKRSGRGATFNQSAA